MLRRRIFGAAVEMNPPEGWTNDDPPCGKLPVRIEKAGSHLVYVSAWELTPDELEKIEAGGSIILRCLGSQPPVALTVELVEEGSE